MSAALKLSSDIFSYSGARVRTTAAPVSRGVCIMSDNVLAGWSVLTEWPRLRLGHSVRTDRQLVHYPIRPSVLSLVLIMFLFPCLFRRLQHTVDFFVASRNFSLLRSLLSLFCSCNLESSCRLHKYKRSFLVLSYALHFNLFPRCFSVFHLDNHGNWEHERRFCLCSIPLVDLSA